MVGVLGKDFGFSGGGVWINTNMPELWKEPSGRYSTCGVLFYEHGSG